MNRVRTLVLVLFVSTALFLVARLAIAQMVREPSIQPSIPIGAGQVTLDYTVFDGTTVQAFIETGSASPLCLATFNESDVPGVQSPILCNQRDFQGKHGVRVVFGFLSGGPTSDTIQTITVYQPGAHGYGQPVLFTTP